MGQADGELREAAPQFAFRLRRGFPGVFEDFVGVEGFVLVEQALRLDEGFGGRAHDTFRIPLDAGAAVGEWPAEAIARAGVARPSGLVPVPALFRTHYPIMPPSDIVKYMDSESSTRLVRATLVGKPDPRQLLLNEPRMLTAFVRWFFRRHRVHAPDEFGYHKGTQIIVFTFFGLCALEGLGTHLVLLLIFGSRWWIWTIFALDVYTLIWIFGLYASMVVLPHRIEADVLRLRYGHQAELVIERAAVRGVRIVRGSRTRNGKVMVDETGRGVFCSGDTTVAIDLDPEFPLRFNGLRVAEPINTLRVTVDAPSAFVALWASSARILACPSPNDDSANSPNVLN